MLKSNPLFTPENCIPSTIVSSFCVSLDFNRLECVNTACLSKLSNKSFSKFRKKTCLANILHKRIAKSIVFPNQTLLKHRQDSRWEKFLASDDLYKILRNFCS